MCGEKRLKMFTFSNSVDVIHPKWSNKSAVKSGNYLYEEVKVLIVITRILGVNPVSRDKNGGFNFEWKSGVAVYTIFLFIIISIVAGVVLNLYVRIILDVEMNFDDGVMMYASVIYMGFHMLPFYMFFEGKKIAKYYTKWRDFEVRYYHAARKPLHFEMKSTLYVFLFVSCFLSICLFYLVQVTIEDLNTSYGLGITSFDFLLMFIIFTYYLWVILAFESNWVFLSLAIRKASDVLLNDLQDNRLRTHFFEDLHKLWLDLSEMAKALGNAFSWTSLYFLAYMFLMVMGSSYSLIASIASDGRNTKSVYLITALACYLMLGYMGDCSYRTSSKLGDEFKKVLLKILLDERDPVMKREYKWFYQIISLNPPVISLSGYVNLSRSFNVSLLGSLVTYMVVVLQFRSNSYQSSTLMYNTGMPSVTPS